MDWAGCAAKNVLQKILANFVILQHSKANAPAMGQWSWQGRGWQWHWWHFNEIFSLKFLKIKFSKLKISSILNIKKLILRKKMRTD
jgi:hypothetical protein